MALSTGLSKKPAICLNFMFFTPKRQVLYLPFFYFSLMALDNYAYLVYNKKSNYCDHIYK